jgi:methyltransferase (TIGR00027 family)
MDNAVIATPDSTAVRVALWRALHVLVDAPPPVLADEIGLELAAPDDGWRDRPDMDAQGTSSMRAAIVLRARFMEDLVEEHAARGVMQYVMLGAGLDTFAQRRPELASQLQVFEVDQPGPQAWKEKRLRETGYEIPDWLHLVPVDFEHGGSWRELCVAAGFDTGRPAIVASTGVTMYLTRDAVIDMLREVAQLARGSTFATTFMLPLAELDPEERALRERVEQGARASGTPFLTFFTPTEIVALAREAGFAGAEHVAATTLAERYLGGRTDGLWPAQSEQLLVARTEFSSGPGDRLARPGARWYR